MERTSARKKLWPLWIRSQRQETLLKGVPRLIKDLWAISETLSSETPPRVNVRTSVAFQILYGFADASEKGFGSTVLGEDGTTYRTGI
jgi:hypothetical protein